jgi:hypothetical protein
MSNDVQEKVKQLKKQVSKFTNQNYNFPLESNEGDGAIAYGKEVEEQNTGILSKVKKGFSFVKDSKYSGYIKFAAIPILIFIILTVWRPTFVMVDIYDKDGEEVKKLNMKKVIWITFGVSGIIFAVYVAWQLKKKI